MKIVGSLKQKTKLVTQCLFFNRFSVKPRTRKCVKEYGFLAFARNLSNKQGEKLIHTTAKTGLDAAKTVYKKLVHKTAKATGELIENTISDKFVKPEPPYLHLM